MKSENSEENLNFAERKLVRVKEREKDRDMERDRGRYSTVTVCRRRQTSWKGSYLELRGQQKSSSRIYDNKEKIDLMC